MKAVFAATLLVLATLPATAQNACVTPQMIAADVAKVPTAKAVITLRSVDIGFEKLVDVMIWGDGSGHYLAVAFTNGCYVSNNVMNDETVAAFIEHHTKRAEPKT